MKVRIKQHRRRYRIEVVNMRPTIEAFHWSVLQENPRIQPLIQQYFGELGAEVCTLLCDERGDPYFQTWGRYAGRRRSSSCAIILYLGPPKGSLEFEKQVNTISWAEILSEEAPFSKQRAIECPWDTEEYIKSRPYRFIFRNDKEIMLAAGLINCAIHKHDNSNQRKQYDLRNANLYGMKEYLELCNLQDCPYKFKMYTESVHLCIESLYESISDSAFEAAMKKFFDANQFSFKTNGSFLENRRYWRKLVSKLEVECQKHLEFIRALPCHKSEAAIATKPDGMPINRLHTMEFLDDLKASIGYPNRYQAGYGAFQKTFNDYIDSRPYGEVIEGEARELVALLTWFYLGHRLRNYDVHNWASPEKWQDAMIYLRYKNKRLFNLGEDEESTGKKALLGYQAIYAFEKVGKEKIGEFLDNFFDIDKFFEHSGKFFDILSEAIGENIVEKFIHQDKPKVISLGELETILNATSEDTEKQELCSLYHYPKWIEFTPEANSKIISLILGDELSSKSIGYFFDTSESVDDYVELYPVIKRVIQTTQDARALWTAGDILNDIWKALPEDNTDLGEWIKKEIYDMFWPRIGGVWAIKCYDSLDLDTHQQKIFDDSLSWIMSLSNITELNSELGNYLKSKFQTDSKSIKKRRFVIEHGEEDFEECFNHLLDEDFSLFEALRYFCYPTDKAEVDFILKKFDECYKDDSYTVVGALENMLLQTEKNRGIGSYILSRLLNNAWFWRLGPEYIIYMFTAACEGVYYEDELSPLRLLSQKTLQYYENHDAQDSFNLNDIKETIDSALKKAERTASQMAEKNKGIKNLRKHTEEISKTMTPPDLANICCLKPKEKHKNDCSERYLII